MTNAINVRAMTCEWCGDTFEARSIRAKYCGRSCGNRAFSARNQKPCSVEGCNVQARARGVCSTHYNRARYTKDQRHKRVTVPCEVCGTPARRRDDQRYQHVCSTACRSVLAWGPERRSGERNRAVELVRRAKTFGADIVDVFDPLEIFERDGWTCYLCDRLCDPTADTCDPMSATIDHVTALRNGGEHSKANARTACLGCNSSKAARDKAAA